VEKEKADTASLLNVIKHFIRMRKACPEIGFGDWEILETDSPNVLAIRYHWQQTTLLVLHNFSNKPQTVTISADNLAKKMLVDVNDSTSTFIKDKPVFMLTGYGCKWYHVANQ
jgi:maltose alpha-D-glucosyltransferase/alpha-amylase